ncbi:VanW family protein [Nocardioides aurantiacus]|uniref:Vancomycin resistance protein YoaR n=1 Tax=Nocardioides aurantiacus TaxID=86796 RepID=A0A3N2CXW5_9ACTN|nr:VanW family protein [Nocardioides aurantiacus]ROR92268.1 vancomycin resistance protein YoaR [Nocardioides aurantiacus]
MAEEHPTSRGPARRRRAALGGVGLVGLVALVWLGVGLWGGDRMPRGTSVGGVAVGGLDRDRAQARLESELGERAARQVRLTYADGRVEPVDLREAGGRLDLEDTLDRASGGARFAPARVWALVAGGDQLAPTVRFDSARLDATLDTLTDGLRRPAVEGTVRFRDGEARPVIGRAGAAVDRDATEQLLQDRFLRGGRVPLPVVEVEPDVSEAEVRAAMRDVARPAMSGPVALVLEGRELQAPPRLFGRGLRMVERDGDLVPEVDGERMIEALAPVVAQVGRAPVDATVEIRDGRPRVVPSRPGLELDPAELEEGFVEAATASGEKRRLQVDGRRARPDLTTGEARELGVREKVSSFTTNFPYAEYRNVNLSRAAELIDGTLLLPGETFSLNGIVGERTAENGFTEGYVVSDGIFRKDLGGGVSQIATTTFNAMFFAGLQDVEHKPHSVYIDRYPEGREATVAWPTLDMSFKNDSPHGVLVTASVTPSTPGTQGAATVEMWSTKRWDVESRTSDRYAFTSPATRTLDDEDCEAATGTGGFSVDVFRDFKRPGSAKVLRTEKFHTDYIPADTVVCEPPG